MENKIKHFNNYIFELYLYCDIMKMKHYATDIHTEHIRIDEFQDKLRELTDEVAEQIYGYFGKPDFNDFTLKLNVKQEKDLGKLLGLMFTIVNNIKELFVDNDKLSGTISLLDDFKGQIQQFIYLTSFDKISTFKLKES